MEFNLNKLLSLSELNKLNKNLVKYESVVNKMKVKPDYNINKIYDSMKMHKISVECNAFDVNEDKQRQCYKQLKCFWPKCRYSVYRKDKLNEHISKHLNKRQFVCEECDKHFKRNSTLLNHKRNVHSTDRPFVCNQINCNKTYKTKSHLITHQLTHSSVKSFGCNKCDKRFKSNSELNLHKKFVHSNIHPFICPQSNCNKSFKRISHLNLHKRIHCSDKPFECDECNQRFKLKYYLSAHKMRLHKDIKRHKCFDNNCDKSFVFFSELKKHIGYKHSNERPFKCDFQNCNSRFKSSANLVNHKKALHLKMYK